LFAVPSEVDLGVIILEGVANAIQPLNVEQANQIVDMYIIFFRILGIVLIAGDILMIYVELKKGNYI